MTENPLKSCGSCTMCCKLLGIKELAKAPGKWCDFCEIGKGCMTYETRPESCREYECMYLMAFDQGITPPLALRPDKSKVVVSPGMGTAKDNSEIVAVHVDPAYRDNWKKEPVYGILARFALDGARIVIGWDNGTEKRLLEKGRGDTVTVRTIHMSEPDENGVQWITT